MMKKEQPFLSRDEEYDFKESILGAEEQKELNELRKSQIDRPFTEEEKKRFLELAKKEEEIKKFGIVMTNEEKTEIIELRKKQIEGKNWTEENRKRLMELQAKELQAKKR